MLLYLYSMDLVMKAFIPLVECTYCHHRFRPRGLNKIDGSIQRRCPSCRRTVYISLPGVFEEKVDIKDEHEEFFAALVNGDVAEFIQEIAETDLEAAFDEWKSAYKPA